MPGRRRRCRADGFVARTQTPGLSGDQHALNLDTVPAGPDADSGTDNIIYKHAQLDGFEHPTCFDTPDRGNHITIGDDLPNTHPVGPES